MSEIKQVWGIIKDYQCADLKMVQDPALAVFQHQQAIIDNLKAQLNNMEACYIEKKKEVEAVDAVLMNWRDEYTEYTHQHECTVDAVLRTCIAELEQALRGAND